MAALGEVRVGEHGIIWAREQDRKGARAIKQHVVAGAIIKIAHGAYYEHSSWRSLSPAHKLGVRALAIVSEHSRGVITGAAAVALHGAWVLTRGSPIVVCGGSQDFRGTAGCHRTARRIEPEHIVEVAGRSVASLPKAILDDCGLRSSRSGYKRNSPLDDALSAVLVAIEGAMRRGVSREELLEVAAQYPRQHGQKLFRAAVGLCHGRCETPGEALMKAALLRRGASFHEQVEIFAPGTAYEPPHFVARVDFYIPSAQLVVEFDGHVKYSRGAVAPTNEEQSRIITDETYRERALRELGLDVVRGQWGDVDGSDPRFISRLQGVIASRRRALERGSAEVRALVKNEGPLIVPGP
nr:hypothetical protein [Corynebacterium lactis]